MIVCLLHLAHQEGDGAKQPEDQEDNADAQHGSSSGLLVGRFVDRVLVRRVRIGEFSDNCSGTEGNRGRDNPEDDSNARDRKEEPFVLDKAQCFRGEEVADLATVRTNGDIRGCINS